MTATSQASSSNVGIPYQVSGDIFTGAAAINVALELPSGRNGLTPVLGLVYGSAARQGSFGRGWSMVGLPVIGIDPDGGLPSYDGRDGYSSSLGGSLVPVRDPVTKEPLVRSVGAHRVERFRAQQDQPRIRFERWVHQPTGVVHWRTRDAANTVTIFGRDAGSRIADPAAPERVYQWLPELSIGARGDAISYAYTAENLDGGAGTRLADQGRGGPQAQRYLKRISWVNMAAANDPDAFDPAAADWAFQAVFDFGDHDANDPAPAPDSVWPVRPDPFSVGTAGFPLRTWRLCRRLLIFHKFDALGPAPRLIEATSFTYDERPDGTLLTSITKTGYRRGAGARQERSVPPLQFGYTQPAIEASFTPAQQALQATAPAGVATSQTVLVDLYGEGLPGILQDDPASWFFQRNLGDGRFAPPVRVQARPSHSLANVTLSDFDGDGNMDAVVLTGQGAGHYRFEREAGAWTPFRPFDHVPTAGGSRFERLDLTGDGRADLLVRESDGLRIHEACGTIGYAPEARRARLPALAARGPAGAPPFGSDASTNYIFADMTGDGLPDQVLIRSGLVAYWPNLGRGRFGEPVVMENAPVLETDGRFAIDRVLLADLDGSGTADLIHLGSGEIRIWANAAGNGFVAPRVLRGLPVIDTESVLDILDISGNGRMCLVWTEGRQNRVAAYQTLALAGMVPPGLISDVANGMGRRDTVVYGHSARHYLRDLGTSRAWTTHLPSHLITVDAIISEDLIGGARYETRYAYRNGAFDSRTRRFAGFGEVDMTTAEFLQGDDDPLPVSEPALVRKFLDQGLDIAAEDRYWNGDPDAVRMPAFALDPASGPVDAETLQDARACLRGQTLREEIYRVGTNGPGPVPMTVTQSGFVVRIEQPAAPRTPGTERRAARQRAVLCCYERESATLHYEGVADDPRTTHGFVLEHDAEGAATLAVSLCYPRRAGQPVDDPGQSRLICDIKRKTLRHDRGDDLLSLNVDIEQEEFSLSNPVVPARGYFQWVEIGAAVGVVLASPLRHDQAPVNGRARRSSWSRSIFWNAAGTAPLAHGNVAQPPRLHHTESAVFSEEFAIARYGAASTAQLEALGYWRENGLWWRATEELTYSGANGFFLPTGHVLDDGTTTSIEYDAARLFAVKATDPNGAEAVTEIDYQALAPRRVVAATGAWQETQYDALRVAVRGAQGGTVIDANGAVRPYGFDPLDQSAPPDVAAALADPVAALSGASQVHAYDLNAFANSGAPLSQVQIFAADLTHDGAGGTQNSGQVGVEIFYRDGHGQPISSKRRVEGGLAIHRDGGGAVVMANGEPALAQVAQRWLSSGWVVRNQKGEVIRGYEPYFSDRPDYEPDDVLRNLGTASQHFSDYAGRVVRMLSPDGGMERVEFGVWNERHFDGNDTVAQSAWRLSREILPAAHPERRALDGSLPHADTPVERIFDSCGRQVRLQEADEAGGTRVLRSIFDDDGEVIRIIDARGIDTSRHVYDMASRKIVEFHVDAGEVLVLFDPRDNPVEVTDDNGQIRFNTFDAQDRVVAVDIATGGGPRRIETITYADDPADANVVGRNLLGLAVEVRDEAGLHRVLEATPTSQPIATATRLIADATQPVDWSGAVALEPQEFVSRSVFDAMGRPVRERRPDGSVLRASYTDGGGLSAVFVSTEDGQVAETEVFSGATYSVTGQRETARLGNGVTLARDYERATQLVRRITATRSAVGGRAPLLQDLNYTYDPVGNVTACTDLAHDPVGGAASAFFSAAPGASAARFYTYDAFYRLRTCEGRGHTALTGGPLHTAPVSISDGTATERFTQTYTYDASNNLTRLRHNGVVSNFTVDFWVDAGSNRSRPALDAGGLPVADPAGDFGAGGEVLRLDHLEALEWRHDQRLSRAIVIDRSASGLPDDDELYVYDGGGMRLRKITRRMLADTSVESTEVTYVGGAEIRRIFRGDVLILERFVTRISDGLTEIAELHRWSRDDTNRETDDPAQHRIRYTLGDHLGSAMLRLDEAARIISYEEFLPYGQRAFAAGDDAREMALKVYGFIGRERDAATGLHYIGQRYYASWLCRWISPDPAGDDDGPNLYQYAHANPVTYYDPTGLQTTDTRERGKEKHETVPAIPPEVIAAFRALPAETQRKYLAMNAAKNFSYYIRAGVVHFGTPAEMRKLADEDLANGTDVRIQTIAKGDNTDPDGKGTGGEGKKDDDADPDADGTKPDTADDGDGKDGKKDDGKGGGKDPKGKDDGNGETQDDKKGTGKDKNDGNGPGDEKGKADGKGALADSDEDGDGGGGTSENPEAKGKSETGTGLGGGKGKPTDTGTGKTPGKGRPGGTGTSTGTGDKPGGKKGGTKDGIAGADGTDPNAKGKLPGGVEGGTGKEPGGKVGGEEGGIAGGEVGGSLDGRKDGNATDDGAKAKSGDGGTRSGPNGCGRGPEGAGSSDKGTKEGTKQGSSQPGKSDEKSGEGGGAKATVMDHVVRIAGYWNLEFSSNPKGSQTGGVPGGMGSTDLGRWGQALYVALTVVDIALTIVSLGGLAAIKAGLKTALKASTKALASFGRKAMAALSVKNLRKVAQLSIKQLSIFQDKIFKWFVLDYKLQAKFYQWATKPTGKSSWLVENPIGSWFFYGVTKGGGAAPNPGKLFGFWPYAKTTFYFTKDRLFNKIDVVVHEGFHAATNLLAWPVKQFMTKTPGGQPVFAAINYLDEVAAYSLGRIASLRVHALPLAPFHAMASTYQYYFSIGGQSMARAAMAWSAAGVAALGGTGYGIYRYFTGEPEPEPGPAK